MAKRKRIGQTAEQAVKTKQAPKPPKLTRLGYQLSLWIGIAGLAAQLLMAILVYGRLASRIPEAWAGFLFTGQTLPKWIVFVLFPVGEIVLLLVAYFSPKDDEGKPVMESGKAWTVIALAAFFTALQFSAFRIH